MLRLSAIFPIVLSIVAFILSLLVLISGYKESFLPNVFVLKIDTSQIAQNINLNQVLSDAGLPSNINTGISSLDSAISDLSSEALGNLLNTAAHELGLHDFYTAHIITWCEGTLVNSSSSLSVDDSDANTKNSAQRVDECTKPHEPFSFDPVAILEKELLHNITLEQIGFPTDDVNKVVNALEKAYRAMSVCYLVGVILAGISILFGLTGFVGIRLIEAANQVIAFLGFVLLGVASAIGTAIAVMVRNIINQKAKDINVHAFNSPAYLGMTWAAVVALLIASMWWCFVCCCGSHDRHYTDSASEKPKRNRF